MMDSDSPKPKRGWIAKFRDAFRGIQTGIHGQSSFVVHVAVAVVVVSAGFYFKVTVTEWCFLIGCIALVLTAEMFNSAMEKLAEIVDSNYNPQLGAALDISSGAVLIASIGAATVGVIVFLPHFMIIL